MIPKSAWLVLIAALLFAPKHSAHSQGGGFAFTTVVGSGVFLTSYINDLSTVKRSVKRHQLRMIGDPSYQSAIGYREVSLKQARKLSLLTNLTPLVVGTTISVLAFNNEKYSLGYTNLGFMGLSMLIAPGTGHWYAGNSKKAWKGILIRSLAVSIVSLSAGGLTGLPEN
ncbi:MAG: hypothetical protein RJQ09_15005 [Cyclobacteriaceae bacterium]